MKHIAKSALLLLLACLSSNVVLAAKIKGNSNTNLGKYTIEKSESMIEHKGKLLETYILCYENCDKQILIGIEELDQCKNFVVVYNDLEIIYACNKNVFGIKKLPKQKTTAFQLKQAIDQQQYYYQKIITRKPKTEKELLALIACYYPQLIEEDYLFHS